MATLQPIEKLSGVGRQDFTECFLKPRKPVVICDLIARWPAAKKWSFDYFKQRYGSLDVPVFTGNYGKAGKTYMASERSMKFVDYLKTIEQGPTDLRLFLFNLFKHAPELHEDFELPYLMSHFIGRLPFMFFGGEGAKVRMHYDIDLAHIFLNQFYGTKKIILFPPEQSVNIYHMPFTVASQIEPDQIDYDKFPALKEAKGYCCELKPGETLFMPSGYWHYVTYLDAGFSMSLRANESWWRRAKGLGNIAVHFLVDKGFNSLAPKRWEKVKTDLAQRRAQRSICRLEKKLNA